MKGELNFTFTILLAFVGFFIGSLAFVNIEVGKKIDLGGLRNDPVSFFADYFLQILKNIFIDNIYGLIMGAIFGLIGLLIDNLRRY
ncbi:MAG: hypothetical protein KatS3mg001_564 [Candidatus Pacearchaeota archaeon]|nr:MAG: hypothetical protein KatS3mg001_564 [Candidatus Pacearchaeota archaeon]